MKTFVWPSNSQNVRSSFDWNDLSSVLNNSYNKSNKRPKWSNVGFEEVEEEQSTTSSIDPEVQDVVDNAKANFANYVYIAAMQAGISQREMMVLIKAFLTGYRSIAEAGMSYKLAAFVEKVTGQKCFDEHDLTDEQRVQAIDLFVEFINSKL